MVKKRNKTKLFSIVLTIVIIIMAVPVLATSSGRTYTTEGGQTYDASAMQRDFAALAGSVKSQRQSYSSDGYTLNSVARNDEPDSWFKSQAGFWYYFTDNRTTTKKGWFDDPDDGQRYYLDPANNGVMLVGWQFIDGYWYYFNESHNNGSNWYDTGGGWFASYGNQVIAYGSLLRSTIIGGRSVDERGRLIEQPVNSNPPKYGGGGSNKIGVIGEGWGR